ncbi:MAG: insulinase family protein [Clostridia bacterium]|nr:insulinase family protein [Clostridia bacterium]
MRPNPISLSHDMTLLHLTEQRFRTDRLTGVFAVPLQKDTAAGYAILPGLLTRSCEDYPTMAAFSRRLDELYGATVQGHIYRLGGWQLIAFSISYLNRRYTLDGSDLTADCTRLLLDMLFRPVLEDGVFPADAFAQEQRCLLERLQGEMNDKRMYARQRCEEVLCPDHPFSLNPNGTEETVAALTPAAATESLSRLLTDSHIHWLYQSGDDPAPLVAALEERFATLPYRRPAAVKADASFTIKESALTEYMPLRQAKLVLGFRIAVTEPEGPVQAAQLMNTLWGGCATSLCFTHVREEQSLCYYCASSYDKFQGVLLVDSGVQPENAQRTKEEVLKQLDAIREGSFSDEELEAARRSLIQRYVSAADHPEALENFYISQTLYDTYRTPEDMAQRLSAITREDVCRAARLTHFDTTYLLMPDDEEVTA